LNSKRLHAYQVMRRVARVKEIRASMALAEAMAAQDRQRVQHDGLIEARHAVAAAGHRHRMNQGDLDMARYEILAQLGEAIDERLGEARSMLSAAEELSRSCAAATVAATRHRENVDEHVDVACQSLEQEHSSNARDDAIELWLKGKSR